MSDWPKGTENCQSCEASADRLRHGGRGLCHRCYYLVRRLEAAEKWAFNRRASFGTFLPSAYADYFMNLSEPEFDAYKAAYVRRIRHALARLKTREERRRGNVDALTLEYKFADILKLLKRKASAPRNASYLANHFGAEQRTVLYALLDDMIDATVKNSDAECFRAGFDAVHELQSSKDD